MILRYFLEWPHVYGKWSFKWYHILKKSNQGNNPLALAKMAVILLSFIATSLSLVSAAANEQNCGKVSTIALRTTNWTARSIVDLSQRKCYTFKLNTVVICFDFWRGWKSIEKPVSLVYSRKPVFIVSHIFLLALWKLVCKKSQGIKKVLPSFDSTYLIQLMWSQGKKTLP